MHVCAEVDIHNKIFAVMMSCVDVQVCKTLDFMCVEHASLCDQRLPKLCAVD